MIKSSDLSKNFNSIEGVKGYVRLCKILMPREEAEQMLYLLGFLDNQGISAEMEINGEVVLIDKSIFSLVKAFNEKGIRTLSSCSGLEEEHIGHKFPISAYLCLSYDESLFDELKSFFRKEISEGAFDISEGESYLKRCISIAIDGRNQEKLPGYWTRLGEFLSACSNDKRTQN